MLEARFLEGVRDVPAAAWDRLAGDRAPFLEWAYLRACEEDSACAEQGMLPRHLTLWDGDELAAALPLYVKGDGRAEFIYDFAWAHFAAQSGISYYPKLVSMAPLTPVTTPRFLVAPGRPPELGRRLAEVAHDWAEEVGLRGVHHLFVTEAEAELLGEVGYVRRVTTQLCLRNPGWTSLDDYLGSFRARHRIKVRREMRRTTEQGLRTEVVRGNDLSDQHRDAMHAFYEDTCLRHGTGSNYLKPRTWELLFEHWRHRLVLFLARDGRRPVAGALCVQAGGDLHGRYWGSAGHWPSLYFNLAFFEPIRYVIEEGLSRFWAGFGNSAHKHARGFQPESTLSAHHLAHPGLHAAIADHLRRERPLVQAEAARLAGSSRLRPRAWSVTRRGRPRARRRGPPGRPGRLPRACGTTRGTCAG